MSFTEYKFVFSMRTKCLLILKKNSNVAYLKTKKCTNCNFLSILRTIIFNGQ